MIVAMCSGQGRTFEALVRFLGAHVTDIICDRPDAHVLQRAQTLNVPAHCVQRTKDMTRTAHETKILDTLSQCSPFTVIALLGYMRVLSAEFLNELQKRWPHARIINLHPAPLSLYKGAHGLRFALESRAPLWGISVHSVTPELDSGPLLAFRTLDIFPTDTFESLRERAHPLEVSAVLEALDILTQRRSPS